MSESLQEKKDGHRLNAGLSRSRGFWVNIRITASSPLLEEFQGLSFSGHLPV